MDKVVVSSVITGLRPKVKQAIVQTIHKFSRQIKESSEKNASKNDAKLMSRLSRLKQEILFIKSINPDVVIRFALLMDFSKREEILNNVHESLETKAVARLATHKSVMSSIDQFRQRFPEWSSQLSGILESFALSRKHPKSMLKREMIQGYEDNIKPRKFQNSYQLEEKSSTKSGNSQPLNNDISHNVHLSQSSVSSENELDSNADDSFSDSQSPDGEEKITRSCSKQDSCSKVSSRNLLAEVRPLAEVLQGGNVLMRNCMENGSTLEKETSEEHLVEDMFFITEENDFLKTTKLKQEKDEQHELQAEMSSEWASLSKNFRGNRAERRAAFLGRGSAKHKFNKLREGDVEHFNNQQTNSGKCLFTRPNKNKANVHQNGSNKMLNYHHNQSNDGNFQNNVASKLIIEPADEDKKLHPSWEAKRKQKILVDTFQGRKIKFDDGGDGKQVDFQHNAQLRSNVNKNRKSNMPDDGLHPSWEAKRRLKTSINIFHGKKVKFDD